MSWNSFKDIASKNLQQKGITPQIQESLIIETANQILLDIFGQEVKDKVRVVYWKNNTLTMAVLSDEILEAIKNKQVDFIDQLNQKFETQVVQDINYLN